MLHIKTLNVNLTNFVKLKNKKYALFLNLRPIFQFLMIKGLKIYLF